MSRGRVIRVDDEVKAWIDARRASGESVNDALRRVMRQMDAKREPVTWSVILRNRKGRVLGTVRVSAHTPEAAIRDALEKHPRAGSAEVLG